MTDEKSAFLFIDDAFIETSTTSQKESSPPRRFRHNH